MPAKDIADIPPTLPADAQPKNTAPIAKENKAAVETAAEENIDPITLKIPSIGLTAPLVKTGLESDGSLHVPSSPDQTGWYKYGPIPGEIGPAVITGHLDSKDGPGILWNLNKVKIGDLVQVLRDDESTAEFIVDKLETYPQDNFATQKVYGPIPNAGLRIITCSGTYSRQAQHYSDDLVVYASLKDILSPKIFAPR